MVHIKTKSMSNTKLPPLEWDMKDGLRWMQAETQFGTYNIRFMIEGAKIEYVATLDSGKLPFDFEKTADNMKGAMAACNRDYRKRH